MSDFYSRYLEICEENKIAPSAAAEAAGLTRAAFTGWGKGALPSNRNLLKLAKYFEIPVTVFYECEDIKARNIKRGVKTKLDIINDSRKEDKKTPPQAVTVDSATKNRHDYVNSLFDQLTFENQIDSINFLKMKLQSQAAQDAQSKSD